MTDSVIDRIETRANDRILVLGIGDGSLARQLARRVADGLVLGVDPSDDAVRQARRQSVELDNVMFVLGSAQEIPWREDFFSLLVADAATLEGAEPAVAVREIIRVMARTGRVAVTGVPGEWPGWLAGEAARQKPGLRVLR